MPDIQAPRQLPDVDLERMPYVLNTPDDATAVSLVVKTFSTYETRRQTHERRWMTAERLYHGAIDKRFWEGTKVERASLPVPIVYDQVEAAYPLITEALFGYYPTFFEVKPRAGASAADAAAIRDTIADTLDTPYDESGMTAIPHLELALRQGEKYGDGVIELSWDAEQKRPIVEWADLRDIYLDPTTPGPLIDWSPALIHRKLMMVEDLISLRGTEGVKIPPDPILNSLAKMRFSTSGDWERQQQAAARKEQYYPTEARTDPAHQLVEVLVYWTRTKLIWVLGRVWCAINKPNPFGFIPYCKFPFTVVEGRPYSQGLPDVLEGEQKYAQGIRNGRLDNLSLALNPPRTRALGSPNSPSASAWRPGMEDRVSDVKQVEIAKVENVTSDAYQEEALIHQGAAKRTGINDFAQSGVPAPSNANRSATGVSTQIQAINSRLRTAVKNFEDYLIVPMLYKIQKMLAKFAPETLAVQSPQGETQQVPKSTLGRTVKFQMLAASRMVTKDRLAMFLGPISQLLFNDALMRQANLQGKTINFSEWERFFQDATSTAKTYDFFRPMNPQEQQMLNQPDPKTQMEMMKAQMEQQTRLQMGQMKSQTEMAKIQAEHHAATTETGEKSARDILKLIADERSAAFDRESVNTITPPKKK